MERVKVIIDTDPGIDDALAILMILEAHRKGEVEVIGVTTTCGNTSVQTATQNALRILELAGMKEIPVFSGAQSSLLDEEFEGFRGGSHVYGEDGFGNASNMLPTPSQYPLKEEAAPLAILRLVKENEGQVVLLALGPLSNVATAINVNLQFTKQLKDFYVMGGNTTGSGNITRCAEFNFRFDPEAAKIVLEKSKIPIKMVTHELCVNKATFKMSERNALGKVDTKAAKMLNKIEEHILCNGPPRWRTYDQVASAWLLSEHSLRSSLRDPPICSFEGYSATVELWGRETRGQMVIEKRDFLPAPRKNVLIMEYLDKKLYVEYLQMGFKYGLEEEILKQ